MTATSDALSPTGPFRNIDEIDLLGAVDGPHRLRLGKSMLSRPPAPLFNSTALPAQVVEEHHRRFVVPGPQFLAVPGLEMGSVNLLQDNGKIFFDSRVLARSLDFSAEPDQPPPYWVRGLLSPAVEIIEIDTPVGLALNPDLIWGHFLLEMLGRVHLLAKLRTMGVALPIAVPIDAPVWVRDFVALYFGAEDILSYHSETQRLRAPCFVMPSMLAQDHHLHPELNAVVAELIRRVLGPGPLPSDAPRLLYLSRGRHRGSHAIANEAEVAATLTDLGFTTIHPQQLSFRDQLALYAGAECIVAQFSSVAHNALFAPLGTPVVCFGWMNALQSRIAALRGQRLAYIQPSDQDLVYPPDNRRPSYYTFTIDCRDLARQLQDFLRFAALQSKQPAASQPPVSAVAPAPPNCDVLMHIESEGDVWFDATQWNGRPGGERRIEGFTIFPHDKAIASHIAYRVMFPDGTASPWTPGGGYCGTRGQGRAVIGLAICVGGADAARYRCTYSAIGRNGETVGPVADGAWCRLDSRAGLAAFSVTIERISEQ